MLLLPPWIFLLHIQGHLCNSSIHALEAAAAYAETPRPLGPASLHRASCASSHADMPEDLVIISKLLDSHTANSPTANSPALPQPRHKSDCPNLSVTVHIGSGAASATQHSECSQHGSLSSPTGHQSRHERSSSPNIYRCSSSLTHVSPPSSTPSALRRTFSSPTTKSCLGRTSSPAQIDWDLALGFPPEANEPAGVGGLIGRSRGRRAGRRVRKRAHAQALRLAPPLEPAGNGLYVVPDLKGDLRGHRWQDHHSTAGHIPTLCRLLQLCMLFCALPAALQCYAHAIENEFRPDVQF